MLCLYYAVTGELIPENWIDSKDFSDREENFFQTGYRPATQALEV
jgi:hypothetical protein